MLRDDPSNVMANHLCVHLYDLAPDRSPALPCARRLDAAAFPAQAEHLAHMPAHYSIETGNYPAALASSERAYALLLQLEGPTNDAEHVRRYLKHDLAVGYSAAMMLGNYATAQLWSTRMDSAYDTSFDALTALRFGRYSEAYAAPDSAFGNPAVRGIAALHLGHTSEARAIAERLAEKPPAHGYLSQLFLARVAEADERPVDVQRWITQAAADQNADFSGELIGDTGLCWRLRCDYVLLTHAGCSRSAASDSDEQQRLRASAHRPTRGGWGLTDAAAALRAAEDEASGCTLATATSTRSTSR